MNRETWLMDLASELNPSFTSYGKPLPSALRVSCGFPSSGSRGNTIGECHYAEGSADGHIEIFIHPKLAEPMLVGSVLLHELCHSALGPGFGHGREFKKIATAQGLEGPMQKTIAGPKAFELLDPILTKLGPYPHGQLATASSAHAKPQKHNAHRNLNCPEDGFHMKVWARQMFMGRPNCPACGSRMLLKAEMVG